MDRVVFIPFAQPYAAEFLERTNNWVAERPEKNFRIVVYNPERARLGVTAGHPALKNLIKGSTIYIRGHGLPGATAVTTSLNGHHVSLPITDAIDRLLEMGLDNSFRGKIKFYSCYSGLAQPPKYQDGGQLYVKRGEFHAQGGSWKAASQALAKTGASYFRQLGFKHCKYYGYLGPLTGKYEESDTVDPGNTHKFCEITTFNPLGDKVRVSTENKITRASEARKMF